MDKPNSPLDRDLARGWGIQGFEQLGLVVQVAVSLSGKEEELGL